MKSHLSHSTDTISLSQITGPRFTLDDARRLIAHVEQRASYHGYAIALYGSVLRNGAGRDLDLMAQPIRIPFDEHGVVRAFAEILGASVVTDELSALGGVRHVELQLFDGRQIDLKVRTV